METIELHTWITYERDKGKLAGVDWKELSTAVGLLRRFKKSQFRRADIEEKDPTIDEAIFDPGGWVGTYRLKDKLIKVIPDPSKLPDADFKIIKEDIVGWLQFIGPFSQAIYGRYAKESLFVDLQPIAYSRHLIDYTEIFLSHFIPRDTISKQYIGSELRGRPIWLKIALQQGRGSNLLVSKRVAFSFRTPQNLLLAYFHSELLGKISNLLKRAQEEKESEFFRAWRSQAAYHQQFLSESIWQSLVEESLDQDFSSRDTLERIRKAGKSEYMEILDLWESYITKRSIVSDFGAQFDTALKPLSKIYELWCFNRLCNVLSIDTDKIKNFPCITGFKAHGAKHKLFYNTKKGLRKHSGFMRKMSVPIGRPDFVVESNHKIVCVLDAKCKTKFNTDDIQRLLSYLLDFVYPKQEQLKAVILYLSSKKEIPPPITAGNCEIYLVPFTPASFNHVKEPLKQILEASIEPIELKVC